MKANRPETIFDVGLHKGEDAEFYLRKGYRVIGVDANPELCGATTERLAEFVKNDRLVVVNRAIAEKAGEITFYQNAETSWGTANPVWAKRNERIGSPSLNQLTVKAVTLADIVEEFGVPHYIKIDIEGLDLTALRSLAKCRSKPKYVSIESDKVSFATLREEFAVFQELGYDRFKIVPQHEVEKQRPPRPPLEGGHVDWQFKWGSSGLFGEEAPGEWLLASAAIEHYKPIFVKYQLWGDDPLISSAPLRGILRRMFGQAGWHDTHARLSA